MKVGVPQEVKNHEYRVAITPIGVHELVAHGHEVLIQRGAGVAGLLGVELGGGQRAVLDRGHEAVALLVVAGVAYLVSRERREARPVTSQPSYDVPYGPVPPPPSVVSPVARASTICDGEIRCTWVSMPPAVRILPSPEITSVDGPICSSG